MNYINEFIDFTNSSKSVYHTIELLKEKFKCEGYQELNLKNKWELAAGGKYYITRNNSTLIAFAMPTDLTNLYFKISANHTDTPGFKLKNNPEVTSENSYMRLNTEVYGGPILNTWFDRQLSVAGRVLLRGESVLTPVTRVVSVDRPLLVIPNVAIHQNSDVNNGIKLTRQNDCLPLITLLEENVNKEGYLLKLLAKENNINVEDILECELFLYDTALGTVFGGEGNLINTSKIDNLASTFAGLHGLLEGNTKTGVSVMAAFDNEEVGSRTRQGGDSNLLLNTLERIILATGGERSDFFSALYKSFMISVDGAHAIHPAKPGKMDIVNKPHLNEGVVIKHSCNQSYSTDGHTSAVIKALAKENNIKFQEFYNNSDERGGSTLGPVSVAHVDIDSIDLGIPMLSMHSVKETAGTKDLESLKDLLKAFYGL